MPWKEQKLTIPRLEFVDIYVPSVAIHYLWSKGVVPVPVNDPPISIEETITQRTSTISYANPRSTITNSVYELFLKNCTAIVSSVLVPWTVIEVTASLSTSRDIGTPVSSPGIYIYVWLSLSSSSSASAFSPCLSGVLSFVLSLIKSAINETYRVMLKNLIRLYPNEKSSFA